MFLENIYSSLQARLIQEMIVFVNSKKRCISEVTIFTL